MARYSSKYFNRRELECGCGCGRAEIHPALLELADTIRGYLGVPLQVNSGVRCTDYNKLAGGRSRSLHVKQGSLDVGHALDLTFSQSSNRMPLSLVRLYVLAESFGRKHGALGLGLYGGANGGGFVHLDVRGKLGLRPGRWQDPGGFPWPKL